MIEKQKTMSANRTYKSKIFAMLYRNKKELLELYNAISGNNYQDPEILEINTLENAIYMSMHNDISFIIDSRLSLYEHQSTYSPNLPLRYLLYVADIYSAMTKNFNLYGTKRLQIPTPQFIIFYNGKTEQPDRQILKLSHAYTISQENPSLELKAIMLNINKGHNVPLMNACKSLRDYAEYTAKVRDYTKIMDLEEAVDTAIEECIRDGILAEFLEQNKMEAKSVSIYEYDMEEHIRMEREEAHQDGRDEKLKEQIEKKMKKGKTLSEIAEDLEEDESEIRRVLERSYNCC